MTRKRPAPEQIALWRYEQIEEALPEELHAVARGAILRQINKTPVRWPSGQTRRISVATLYRWCKLYRAGGLAALRPKTRSDHGRQRQILPEDVVQEALRLLGEDPGISLTFLLAVLEATFRERKLVIPRSTLQRRLAEHPSYARIQRARAQVQRRTRFVAKRAHDIWHMDAKGPVSIVLTSGAKLVFHVLSIIDDATRALLAALIVLSPDLGAAVRVFRMAALRWGLPSRYYADRAAIFDSHAFRAGLALLGVHRIRTKARNAQAHGKIEAYHRVLTMWFTDRLQAQAVIDMQHLQQLLDGVLAVLYQQHHHRGIRCPPTEALAGKVSPRTVPPARLFAAFGDKRSRKAHRVTGELDIKGVTYLVPDELRGQRLTIVRDPAGEVEPVVLCPHSGETLHLRRAAIRPADLPTEKHPSNAMSVSDAPQRWGRGPLQAIYDDWCGAKRPQAEPGFGLPEIYRLLARVAERHVPASDAEAALVMRVYREHGPLPRIATEQAMRAISEQLGPRRPIATYLDALVERIRTSKPLTPGASS